MALCSIGIMGALMHYGLNSLATYAERDLDAYPFMEEDWLRYLVPTRFVQKNTNKILLTGPSTVRENMLYERFEEEFPDYAVIQGGLSLGTIDDVTAALQYIRRVYGDDALPDILVLGISPRFIANIPENRALKGGIDRYSPYFSTLQNDAGLVLVPKDPAESLMSRYRFLVYRQPDRYRTAIFSLSSHLIAGELFSQHKENSETVIQKILNRLFKLPEVKSVIVNTRYKRAVDYDFTEVLAWLSSPYKYRLSPPPNINGLISWMDEKNSWWQDVHSWDPRATAQATRASLERFHSEITENDIDLFVVNMPERDVSRVRYNKENYDAYLEIVRNTLGNAHFLDLQDFLQTGEFHDLEHSIYPGSLRLTNKIISYMKASVN